MAAEVDPHDVVGSVHSWELVTAVDGPGTRMTIFLAGCPLRCLYCHNPDTRYANGGTTMTVGSLVERAERYKPIFKATGGGVTISGGEALMQPIFLSALIDELHKRSIPVTLDTSGYGGKGLSDETLSKLSLVLLDVKSGISEVYKKVTKRPLEPTLAFGKRVKNSGVPIWVRFVLVPDLTDAVENVAAVGVYAASLGDCVERMEILPFHQMGRSKWDELGLKYELGETPVPSEDLIARVKAQFEAEGLNVTVG